VPTWRPAFTRRDPETQADYQVYVDEPYVPRVQLWLHAFDEEGAEIDREWINTNGYSFREYVANLATDRGPHGRFWLVDQAIRAHARLVARIGPARDSGAGG
jgi:hypothetical protein